MEYLDILEKPSIDNSIAYERFIDHHVDNQTQLNTQAELRITTSDKDAIVLLEKSFFVFDIDVTKLKDGSRFTTNDKIGFVNNAAMFLFSEASLWFDETLIEKRIDVGRDTLVYGNLIYDYNFSNTEGYALGWYRQTSPEPDLSKNIGYGKMIREFYQINEDAGKYRFIVPFNHIFGFSGKILMGMKYKVVFKPADKDQIIFRTPPAAGAPDDNKAKVELTEMIWSIPFLTLNDGARGDLHSKLDEEPKVQIPINSRLLFNISVPNTTLFDWSITSFSSSDKPYGLILFFQTGKLNPDQFINQGVFDHCDVDSIKLFLNQEEYPGVNLINYFEDRGCSDWYERYISFRKNVLGLGYGSQFTPNEFKQVCPMFVFDLTSQKERITGNSIDCKVKCKFNVNVPANTIAYAVILTNKLLTFKFFKDRSMKFLSSF